MKNLLLTLGHNSSAILIEDGQLVCGYENERVTGKKSDSAFPLEAMTTCDTSKPDIAYVTHWSPDGQLGSMAEKYWKPEHLENVPIRTLSPERTHHDAHMAAAMCYAGPHFSKYQSYGFVVDGFGIFGEHFSVYDLMGEKPRLLRRYRGYGTSLGLWYQYATAFMGMKMHEDEYKLLGYEAHCTAEQYERAQKFARETADQWLIDMETTIYKSEYDPLFNLNALTQVRERFFKHLTDRCRKDLQVTDPTSFDGRCALAAYVQAVLEMVVRGVVDRYKPENLVLSGGVFFNVKLNLNLLNAVHGVVCINPLSGDQGNAIGLYAMDNPLFVWPKTLNWGRRVLRSVGVMPNLHVLNEADALDLISKRLTTVGYVNLVRGGMEFGPRALCNTSTLALPRPEIVSIINEMNDRNTVMPMAPVMNYDTYGKLFKQHDRVWRSMQHMVCAMEFENHVSVRNMLGAAHEYSNPRHYYTARPQVLAPGDMFMNKVIDTIADGPTLINTSFNFHGMPIALGMYHIMQNHMMQYQRNPQIHTVVIRNDN